MFLAGALGKVLIMHTLVFVIGGYFICSILVSNCDGEVTYFVILGYRYFGMLAMFSLHLAADLTCPWRSRPRCVTWSRLRSLQFGQTCHAPGRRPRVTSLSQSRPWLKLYRVQRSAPCGTTPWAVGRGEAESRDSRPSHPPSSRLNLWRHGQPARSDLTESATAPAKIVPGAQLSAVRSDRR